MTGAVGPRPKALVWTRAHEDWEDDQRLLRPVLPPGIELVHIPCIVTEPLSVVAPNGPFDAAVILSPNTVHYALLDAPLRAAIASAKVIYTHGAATADNLKREGLKAHLVGEARTSEDLARWLAHTLPPGSLCLWPTAAEPAYDLALGLPGLNTVRVNCYRTEAGARQENGHVIPEPEVARLAARLAGVICFASPSAVRGFAKVFHPKKCALEQTLAAVVMGPTTAKAARAFFRRVEIAESSSLSAMIRLATALSRK